MGIFDKGVKKTNLNFFQKLGRAIVGKPAIIWLSTDGNKPFPQNIRWKRFFKIF